MGKNSFNKHLNYLGQYKVKHQNECCKQCVQLKLKESIWLWIGIYSESFMNMQGYLAYYRKQRGTVVRRTWTGAKNLDSSLDFSIH